MVLPAVRALLLLVLPGERGHGVPLLAPHGAVVSLSLSLMHTHTLSLFLSHTNSHTHTHTHSLSLSLSIRAWWRHQLRAQQAFLSSALGLALKRPAACSEQALKRLRSIIEQIVWYNMPIWDLHGVGLDPSCGNHFGGEGSSYASHL